MAQEIMTAEPIADSEEALWVLAHENSCLEPVYLHFDQFEGITGWFITVPECSEHHARVTGYDYHYAVESALAHALIGGGLVMQVPEFDRSLFFFVEETYQITPATKKAIWERCREMKDMAKCLVHARHPALDPEAIKTPYFKYREHGLHGPWRFHVSTPLGEYEVFPSEQRVETHIS